MQIFLLSVHPGKAGLRGGALERKRMLFVLRRACSARSSAAAAALSASLCCASLSSLRRKAPAPLRCSAPALRCGFPAQKTALRAFPPALRALVLSVHALEVRAAVFEVCVQHRNAARLPGLAALRLAQRRAQRFGLAVDAMQISRQLLRLLIAPFLLGFLHFPAVCGRLLRRVSVFRLAFQPFELFQPQRHLENAQFIAQNKEFLRFFRLFFERLRAAAPVHHTGRECA